MILVLFTRTQINATSASCTGNTCFSTDSITLTDVSQIFHFGISGIDGFIFGEHSILKSLGIIKVFDTFNMIDSILINRNTLTTITTLITDTITQIVATCSGSACYQNPSATGMEAIAEDVIFPLIFIAGTVFGFLYMGIKFFGIAVMISTFIILGLAYIGIIPSYFTLLTIIAVGAALTKMISGMLGGNNGES